MPEYFQRAADLGNANAQFNFGFCYYIAQGVAQDYDKAFTLFEQSAKQGFPDGMFAYGDCCCLGTGVEKNLKTTAKWYQKALDAGYEPDDADREHLDDVLGEGWQE